jgi:hypothetical protein
MKLHSTFFLLITFAFLFLVSCISVDFVRRDYTPVKQGILRHSPASGAERVAKYRDEVNKQAREFCKGDFTITKEYDALGEAKSTAGIGTGFGVGGRSSVFFGSSVPSETMYSFVEFTCK